MFHMSKPVEGVALAELSYFQRVWMAREKPLITEEPTKYTVMRRLRTPTLLMNKPY